MVVEIYNKKGKHYRDRVNKTRFMERDTQLRNMKNESGKETKHQVAKKMKLTLGLATYFNNHVQQAVLLKTNFPRGNENKWKKNTNIIPVSNKAMQLTSV